MTIGKRLFGAISLSLVAMGVCLPTQAQTVLTAESEANSSIASESPVLLEPDLASINEVGTEDGAVADMNLIETQQENQPLIAVEGFSLNDLRA